MKKEIETIQGYKVDGGSMLITQLTKSEMKKERFFSSPIDALDDALESHRYNLRNEEYHLKHRRAIVYKLQDVKARYLNGDDSGIFGNCIDGATDICNDDFKSL